jgi:hypothetical protein
MKQYDSPSILTRFAPGRLRFTRFSSGHEDRDDGRTPERSITILRLVYAVDFFLDVSHPDFIKNRRYETYFSMTRRYWRIVVNDAC